MRNALKFGAVAALALSLAACQAPTKTQSGTVIGAGAGGAAGYFLGNAIGGQGTAAALTGVGVLLGAFAGNSVGQSLDRADELYAMRAAQRSFEYTPTGQATEWQNPDTGVRGTVVPTATFNQGGRTCREFTHTIYISGTAEQARGTACRATDGSGYWEIQ